MGEGGTWEGPAARPAASPAAQRTEVVAPSPSNSTAQSMGASEPSHPDDGDLPEAVDARAGAPPVCSTAKYCMRCGLSDADGCMGKPSSRRRLRAQLNNRVRDVAKIGYLLTRVLVLHVNGHLEAGESVASLFNLKQERGGSFRSRIRQAAYGICRGETPPAWLAGARQELDQACDPARRPALDNLRGSIAGLASAFFFVLGSTTCRLIVAAKGPCCHKGLTWAVTQA